MCGLKNEEEKNNMKTKHQTMFTSILGEEICMGAICYFAIFRRLSMLNNFSVC